MAGSAHRRKHSSGKNEPNFRHLSDESRDRLVGPSQKPSSGRENAWLAKARPFQPCGPHSRAKLRSKSWNGARGNLFRRARDEHIQY